MNSTMKSEYKDGVGQPVVKKEEANTTRSSIKDIPEFVKPEENKVEEDHKALLSSSLYYTNTTSHNQSNKNRKMSNSQPLCTFGDIAVTYRIYILDDLLAEPQEVCHDWGRNLLYVAQRYRQGNAYAPIEASGEVSVVDLATAETCAVIDLGAHGYSAPHALELDHDAVYLSARVAEGMVWIDAESRCVTNFADRSQISASNNASASSSHVFGSSGSSSSRRHRGHHGSSSRHGHSSSSSSSSSSSGNNSNFIAELDLRSGKIRQRVMVPDSEQQDADSGFVTFSSPAIRFASRQSSDGMPVVAVEGDPIVAAIRHKYGVKAIYITSRNVMLV
ncbi:uncharacterized protein PG998_005668 [Apiospora kogelbergensis]